MLNFHLMHVIILVSIFTLPTIIKHRKNLFSWRLLVLFFFYVYISMIILIVLLPMPVYKESIEIFKGMYIKNNYIPFKSIIQIINNLSLATALKQVMGNIIMFVPFGFFIPILFRKYSIKKYTIICFLIACSIEMSQLVLSNIIGVRFKITDIDDVILNLSGGVIGYYIFNPTWALFKKITGMLDE